MRTGIQWNQFSKVEFDVGFVVSVYLTPLHLPPNRCSTNETQSTLRKVMRTGLGWVGRHYLLGNMVEN